MYKLTQGPNGRFDGAGKGVTEEKNLLQIQNKIQVNICQRNKKRIIINKSEYKRRKLARKVNSLSNEISKLTSLIKQFDTNLMVICRRNDLYCEKRNVFGVHLININEDLCKFYEQINQLNEMKQREDTFINQKKDEKNRLRLEIGKWANKLDIMTKKVQEIPVVSRRLIDLKAEVL